MILKIIQQIIQMFDKIQMILMMKMSVSSNRILRLNSLVNEDWLHKEFRNIAISGGDVTVICKKKSVHSVL